ncbi:MAG: hypothetical protein IJH87_02260, partial [Atopobiaceae bacterium]|nr:hypothetical protein [Atopobiaceae bacterium]
MGPILKRIVSIIEIILGIFTGLLTLAGISVFLDDLPYGVSTWAIDVVMLIVFGGITIALFSGAIKRLSSLDSGTPASASPSSAPIPMNPPVPGTTASPINMPAGPTPLTPAGTAVPSGVPIHKGEQLVSVKSVIPIPGHTPQQAPAAPGSSTPIPAQAVANTEAAAPSPSPAARPTVPQPSAPSIPAPSKQGESMAPSNNPTEALDSFVLRSNNVFASLRDLVDHEASAAAGRADMHAAALLLRETGIQDWEKLPKADAMRLRRTDQFWFTLGEEVDTAGWKHFIAAETALNLAREIVKDGVTSATAVETIRQQAVKRLFGFFTRDNDRWDALPDVQSAYPKGTAPEDTPGEWISRMAVSWFCEYAPTPQRIAFDMSGNASEGCMVIDLYVPDPEILSFLAEGIECARLSRSWAFRMAITVGEEALVSHRSINRVVVNARPFRDKYTHLLSIDLDAASLARMKAFAAAYGPETGAIPSDPSLRVRLAQDGWFLPIDPWMRISDPLVDSKDRWQEVESIDRACSEQLKAATGALRVCDLGINENSGRIAAWREFNRDFPASTEEAVSKLMAIRDSAGDDLSVAEAASRTSEALVKGDADISDVNQLRSIFVNGSALDVAVTEAERILDDEDADEDDYNRAIAILEEALA